MRHYSQWRLDRLYRSRSGIFLGVCKGLARFLDVPVFWFRVFILVLTPFTGVWPMVAAYLIAGFVIKPEPVLPPDNDAVVQPVLRARRVRADHRATQPVRERHHGRRHGRRGKRGRGDGQAGTRQQESRQDLESGLTVQPESLLLQESLPHVLLLGQKYLRIQILNIQKN